MRPSTLAELAGFAALVTAAFMWNTIAGLCALGVSLLLIGYATEDDQVALSVARMIHPVTSRHAARKARREAKRAGRA